MAAAYSRWRASDVGRITDAIELELVLEMLGDVRGRKVLDIGCGDGRLAIHLAQAGAEVTGIDISPSMVESARLRASHAGVTASFCVGSAEALPFKSGTFDLVVAVTVLCFIPDPRRAFNEAGRVTLRGGRFVIGELGRFSTWAAERRIRAWLGNAMWRRAKFRSAGVLRRQARLAGLDPVEVRGAVFYPKSKTAAIAMRRFDPWLGKRTTFGAAFIALAALRI